MTRQTGLTFLAGALAGLVVALAVTGRPAAPRAAAQPPEGVAADPGGAPHFAVAAWSYGTNASGTQGAYVVDTRTGEVFSVRGDGEPKPLGRAGR